MITKSLLEKELADIQKPYIEFMIDNMSEWRTWADLSDKMEAGITVTLEKVPEFFQQDYKWISLLLEMTAEGGFNWSDPRISSLFSGTAEIPYYRLWGETIAASALRIADMIQAETILEIGAGKGDMTSIMLKSMDNHNKNIPLVITDSNETVLDKMKELKKNHPQKIKEALTWDINNAPSDDLIKNLEAPVVVYERASFNYSNYRSLENIFNAGTAAVLGDFFKYRNELYAYDRLSERIGLKPLMYDKVKSVFDRLKIHDYLFDFEASKKLGYPDITVVIAWRE